MPCAPPELRVLGKPTGVEDWLGSFNGQPAFCAVTKWKDIGYLDRKDQLGVLAVRKLAITMEFLGIEAAPADLLVGQRVDSESFFVVIGCRSPLTIDKRASSLRTFHKWGLEGAKGSQLLSEAVAWPYLKDLKRNGAAPS